MREKTKKLMMNIKEIIKQNRRLIIMFVSIIIFIMILEDIFESEVLNFDIRGYYLISKLTSNFITDLAKVVTSFASPIILLIVTATLFISIKNKKIKYSIVINLAISVILNFILKNIIQRPRPTDHRLIDEFGYSFPSGHSMVSMAFYGYLMYLILKNIENKYVRIFSAIIIGALIICIGLSRVYLGVHYSSDVVGGFMVALSYLMLYTGILKRIPNKS